ncbi:DEAD/DEAH box helicase, partial [Escherichia coli]
MLFGKPAITLLPYLTMTPVQAAALPAILAGKDVRVQAKT